jgi:long-chain acyl-CoA synthetase
MDWRSAPRARAQLATGFGAALVVREADMPDIAGMPSLAIDELLRATTVTAAPAIQIAVGGARAQSILSTSGTTGAPKGMLVTYDQWIARMEGNAPIRWATPNIRCFSAGPMVFYATLARCFQTLCAGKTLILYPPLFTPQELVTAIDRYRPDTLFLVPTIVRHLLDLAPAEGMLFPNLRNLVIRGAALHATEKQEIARRIAGNVYDVLGSTGAHTISCLYPSELRQHAHSVGRVVPWLRVQIVDEEDCPVRVGGIGRLRCAGPTVISGWAGPVSKDDPEFLRDGWYYTSDLAAFDAEGYLHIEGRASDVIQRGGATVYAAEIEAVLLDHPAVQEAAVLGYSSGDLAEEVAAFVVLRVHIDTGRLIGHCRDRLGPNKVPRRIVVCENLPKTTSGKIRKRDLAALLQTN